MNHHPPKINMTASVVLRRLRENKPILLCVPTPVYHESFLEMAAFNGYHGTWIDHQHQNYSDDQIAHMCVACRAGGMDAVVRVRKRDAGSYSKALEWGGHGVIIPHVNTAAEAREIVRELKFPPEGNRGLDGVESLAKFGYIPATEYVRQANAETFVVVQIEEPEAVDNVEQIAAVKGIDVLMIGPGDLTLRYGCTGQITAPKPWAAVERVAAAARQHGIHWGLPAPSVEMAQKYMELGARFFAHGSVWGFVHAGFERVKKEFGELFDLDQQAAANQQRGY